MARPIIILGTARSGTTLLARIFGSSPEIFLLTEIAPRLKERFCPEDESGLSDSELWRGHFDFHAWDVKKARPVCERPIFDRVKIESMRTRYVEMAGGKRLVIKNPLSLARVDMLKAMFPEALFVFSLRAPWPTIQAATIKGSSAYLLHTEFVNSLANNLVLRAAASWAESIDILNRERDHNWVVVRYEDLVANPRHVICDLYSRAGMTSTPEQALNLPENRIRDYSFIKYELMRNSYRSEVRALIVNRARAVGYDPKLSLLPGSGLRYAAQNWLNAHRPRTKSRKLRVPGYAAA